MPSPKLLRTAAVTLAVVAAFALGVALAVRAKIRDEGARSVSAAMDAAFGADGWSAAKISFSPSARSFTARSVSLKLPAWALSDPLGGEGGSPPIEAAGPLTAEELEISEPPLPMALQTLAADGFRAGTGEATALFGSLKLTKASVPFRRGREVFTAEAEAVVLSGASLEDPAPLSGSVGREALLGLSLREAAFTGLTVRREGSPPASAEAASFVMDNPALFRSSPRPAAPDGGARPPDG
ncbi:MAG: hypothetical protein LBQ12_09925 [Deltaproteobacteria bacterium]|jgi:hypothetical protein|nr:hypothetical protein [Deltaproteobacteria bacterium]